LKGKTTARKGRAVATYQKGGHTGLSRMLKYPLTTVRLLGAHGAIAGLPGEAGYQDLAELCQYAGPVRLDSEFRNSEFIGDLFVATTRSRS
jgi:hypothetical protein